MQLELLRHFSSAEDIIVHPEDTLIGLNADFSLKMAAAIRAHRSQALKLAKDELDFCRQHSIKVLSITAADYPHRLRECPDAPPVIFYRGTADLNARHVLAVVGTRKITEYGKQVCARLTERLAELLPDTLVVSGLAYGVDIHSHRGCMEHGLPTVGVVAHGMDQIYPATHRNDAKRMVANGGILTEYTRGTRPLQGNFLRRNRIVAGMADATVVVESAQHGGSLVTARIAHSYERHVFTFPGRINDPQSVGCNELIRSGRAAIALTADDIVRQLGWWEETTAFRAVPQQLDLFGHGDAASGHNQCVPSLPAEQRPIAEALLGTDGLNTAALAAQLQMPAAEVNALLFDMELAGAVKVLPGGFYMLKK